jgi:hypothetical protein
METTNAPAQSLEMPELETPREIAKALRTTPQTVNTWHRKGIIPARVSIGRIVRFDRREVIAALTAASSEGSKAV